MLYFNGYFNFWQNALGTIAKSITKPRYFMVHILVQLKFS